MCVGGGGARTDPVRAAHKCWSLASDFSERSGPKAASKPAKPKKAAIPFRSHRGTYRTLTTHGHRMDESGPAHKTRRALASLRRDAGAGDPPRRAALYAAK